MFDAPDPKAGSIADSLVGNGGGLCRHGAVPTDRPVIAHDLLGNPVTFPLITIVGFAAGGPFLINPMRTRGKKGIASPI